MPSTLGRHCKVRDRCEPYTHTHTVTITVPPPTTTTTFSLTGQEAPAHNYFRDTCACA